ncbi:MAG: hypothetical protein R2862_03555 [Thermoanaerobaculia bacterium]
MTALPACRAPSRAPSVRVKLGHATEEGARSAGTRTDDPESVRIDEQDAVAAEMQGDRRCRIARQRNGDDGQLGRS